MKPSKELDGLVAEAMGQKRVEGCPLGDPGCPGKYEPQIGRWPCLPPYSTDTAAAMEAWEWLEQNNSWRERETESLILFRWQGKPSVGRVFITLATRGWCLHKSPLVSGETYAHAVCLAVLEAVKQAEAT